MQLFREFTLLKFVQREFTVQQRIVATIYR